jgi:hypothetical protein
MRSLLHISPKGKKRTSAAIFVAVDPVGITLRRSFACRPSRLPDMKPRLTQAEAVNDDKLMQSAAANRFGHANGFARDSSLTR